MRHDIEEAAGEQNPPRHEADRRTPEKFGDPSVKQQRAERIVNRFPSPQDQQEIPGAAAEKAGAAGHLRIRAGKSQQEHRRRREKGKNNKNTAEAEIPSAVFPGKMFLRGSIRSH